MKEKLPGFTSEQSVSSTSQTYKLNASFEFQKGIIPQLIRKSGPWSDWCIPGCICVSPDNCPCCEGLHDPRRKILWY